MCCENLNWFHLVTIKLKPTLRKSLEMSKNQKGIKKQYNTVNKTRKTEKISKNS